MYKNKSTSTKNNDQHYVNMFNQSIEHRYSIMYTPPHEAVSPDLCDGFAQGSWAISISAICLLHNSHILPLPCPVHQRYSASTSTWGQTLTHYLRLSLCIAGSRTELPLNTRCVRGRFSVTGGDDGQLKEEGLTRGIFHNTFHNRPSRCAWKERRTMAKCFFLQKWETSDITIILKERCIHSHSWFDIPPETYNGHHKDNNHCP